MFGVTILIPTFNRAKFSKLIVHNINCQTYPCIEKIIIADDGDELLDLSGCKYDVEYIKTSRVSIGQKRNFLKSRATTEFCAFMDTDDFYHPEYISSSIFSLLKTGKEVTGSADMIMYDGRRIYRQSCCFIDMLNEATLVFRTSYRGMFETSSRGEGKKFLNKLGAIVEGDIEKIMICVCHTSNTINKTSWLIDKYVSSYKLLDPYVEHIMKL
jgi:glycosyltransferase involved in cell wall biosynthesis